MVVAQRSGRARYRLLLLLLTAATLLTADFRGFGPLDTAQGWLRDLLEPLVSGAEVVLGPVADVWTVMFTYNDLRETNAQLSAELDRLRTTDIRSEARDDAFERLRDATGVRYVSDIEQLAATVLRESVGNFEAEVVAIDVGHRHGVVSGMAVVTSAGLVGRVDTVDAVSSTVTMVSDPNLVIGVRLLDTGDVALGHGMAGDPRLLVVDAGLRWPDTGDLSELPAIGSAVVTAAGSRFPADVPVGRIVAVEPADAGLTQVVTVELAADVEDLGYVTVLLQEPTDSVPVGPDSPFGGVAVNRTEESVASVPQVLRRRGLLTGLGPVFDWLRIAVVLAVALLLQLTLFLEVRVFGVAPELPALVAVLGGLLAGARRGCVIAFCAGLRLGRLPADSAWGCPLPRSRWWRTRWESSPRTSSTTPAP